MSVKLKFLLILILSIFATAGAGVYMIQHPTTIPIVDNINTEQPQKLSDVQHSQEIVENPERRRYKNIPLASINAPLQGSDPMKLAVNFLDDFQPTKSDRQVEVVYPQPHQALVTVIQTPSQGDVSEVMKYRLEMSSFGRSLLSSSPPIWQIVWVGAQIQCQNGNLATAETAQVNRQKSKLSASKAQQKNQQAHCEQGSREFTIQD